MEAPSTKERLLRAAERLFALEGIDAISMRRICAEAGQRNNNALQYHFGGKHELVEAILVDRMTAINAERRCLLRQLGEGDQTGDLRALVHAFIAPFAAQLADREGGRYYILFSARLFLQGKAMELLKDDRPWTRETHAIISKIRDQLPELPEEILVERLTLMADQAVHATAAKDRGLEELDPRQRKEAIDAFVGNLVDYIVGGLMAPSAQGIPNRKAS